MTSPAALHNALMLSAMAVAVPLTWRVHARANARLPIWMRAAGWLCFAKTLLAFARGALWAFGDRSLCPTPPFGPLRTPLGVLSGALLAATGLGIFRRVRWALATALGASLLLLSVESVDVSHALAGAGSLGPSVVMTLELTLIGIAALRARDAG